MFAETTGLAAGPMANALGDRLSSVFLKSSAVRAMSSSSDVSNAAQSSREATCSFRRRRTDHLAGDVLCLQLALTDIRPSPGIWRCSSVQYAVIADVPLVAPSRYVVVENDVVIVDPARWRLTCTRSLSPITTRSAAFDRPGGDDPEPPRQLLLWHPLGTHALSGSRVHLAHRWFCKLDLDDKIPHRATFSENLGRFRESDMLRHIFERVVWEATAMGPQGRGLCCRCRRALGPTPAAIMETRPMSSIREGKQHDAARDFGAEATTDAQLRSRSVKPDNDQVPSHAGYCLL